MSSRKSAPAPAARHGRMKRLMAFGWKVADKFVSDNITLYSAQTAYFVVVSMIPFAAVLVPLLSLLIPDDTVELLNSIILLLPGQLGDIANRVLKTLFQTPSSSVISLYVLISLWAASKGIMSLQNGLHGIYHVKETENYFVRRGRCVLYTLVFMAAILFALVLLVMGNTFERFLSETLSFWGLVARVVLAFRTLISVAIFVLAFTGGYKYLAGTRCTFRDALPGVTLTTVAWIVFSGFYSIYISHISQYITLYGSLGALIFLFLWLYFCILILMVGAEFNVYYAEWRHHRQKQRELEEAFREMEEAPAGRLMKEYVDQGGDL